MVSDSEPTGLTRKYFQTVNIGWLKSKVRSSGWFMELVRETTSDLFQMNKNNFHKCGYVLHGNIQMIRTQNSEMIFFHFVDKCNEEGENVANFKFYQNKKLKKWVKSSTQGERQRGFLWRRCACWKGSLTCLLQLWNSFSIQLSHYFLLEVSADPVTWSNCSSICFPALGSQLLAQ